MITSGEGAPFVVRVIEPLIAAEDAGAKIALNVVLPPAAMVVDVERPVWLIPEPATVTCENVNVELPLFLRVTCAELLLPTATFPKLTLAGLDEICACVPVPLSEMPRAESEALLLTVKVPESFVDEVGAN